MTQLEQALGPLAARRDGHLVAGPRNERELSQLFAVLRAHRAAVGRDVSLDRSNLRALGPVDDRSMTIEAGAGVAVREVEARARAHRLTLGPLAPSAWGLSVGELVEHSGHAFRPVVPGRLEPLASRVVAVLADGHVIASPPGPRHAAGPELTSLVVGGGGAIGLVTSATLRLSPLNAGEVRRTCSFAALADAVEALRASLAAGALPARVVLRGRAGRLVVEVSLTGSAAGIEREAALVTRCAEHVRGRFEGPGREAGVDGVEAEVTWDDVASALADGAAVELFRLSLSTVMARGVPAPTPARADTRLSTLFDPSSILPKPP